MNRFDNKNVIYGKCVSYGSCFYLFIVAIEVISSRQTIIFT